MKAEPKRAKNLRRLEKDKLVGPWLRGYKKGSRRIYRSAFNMFLKWAKTTPKQMIAERKADMKNEDDAERHRYERLVLDCFKKKKAESASSAFSIVKAIRAFFDYHYLPLKFRRQEAQEFSKGVKPVFVDYLPTREDLKAMVEVADVRDRGVLLTEASTGLSGDVCEFTRQQFEQGLTRRAAPHDPVCMAPRGDYLRRVKTNVRMRPFLTRDATQAIQIYFKTRKDDAPWLFVDKSGNKLTPDAINKMVQRLAEKAALPIPEGQRIRMHCFRKFFNEAANNADITREWICILYGHEIEGSEDFYATATEDKLREKFKRAEPQLSISRLSNMALLRKEHEVALDDHEREEFEGMKRYVGKKKFRRWAEFEVSIKRTIKWDPETEYEPALYRRQRILNEMLNEMVVTPSKKFKKQTAPRERKRGA
ncbi:Tyrosine recombinase XerC [subsurface metagenome]|nr:tyrosine-type recombinase/integrase [Hadesarchaea archaeon]